MNSTLSLLVWRIWFSILIGWVLSCPQIWGAVGMDPSFSPSFGGAGLVNAMALQSDGKVVVGGFFDRVGAASVAGLARLTADGQYDRTFATVLRGEVTALAVQPADGKILVAGDFQDRTRNLIRLNTDGSVDSSFLTNVWAESRINALVVAPDGKIFVGGQFGFIETEAGTVWSRGIAKLLPNGQPDAEFYPFAGYGPFSEQSVDTLALAPDGSIYVGGWFDSFNEFGRVNLARLGPDGNLDLSFGSIHGPNERVRQIVLRNDGALWVAGEFDWVEGIPCQGLALLNLNGTVDTRFNAEIPSGLHCSAILPLADGEVLAAVLGTELNTTSQSFLRLSASGNRLESFKTAFETSTFVPSIRTLVAIPSGTFLFGGYFKTSGSRERISMAEMQSNGIVSDRFTTPFYCEAMLRKVEVQKDGKIVVAGLFSSLNGLTIPNLARLNPDGTADESYRPAVTGTISAMTLQPDGKILIGGTLSGPGIHKASGVARLNIDGSLDLFVESRSLVQAIFVDSRGRILLCTEGPGVGSPRAGCITRLMPDGTLDFSFWANPSVFTDATAIAQQSDGKLIVSAADQSDSRPYYVVRLVENGELDASFNILRMRSSVNCLAVDSQDRILLGGSNFTWDNTEPGGLRRLSADGSRDSSFNPPFGRFSEIQRIKLLQSGKMLAAGWLSPLDNEPWVGLARLNDDGSKDLSFSLGDASSYFLGMDVAEQADGRLLFVRQTVTPYMGVPLLIRFFSPSAKSVILGIPSFTREGEIQFKVALSDGSPRRIAIEMSEDLHQWTLVQNLVTTGEREAVISARAAGTSRMFFRALASE